MKRMMNFLQYNNEKGLTIAVWFWTGFFRMCILMMPARCMKRFYGSPEEESRMEETREHYEKAKKIAYHVNRVASHTPWESKCLVRALAAQKLLSKQRISSTLYLGVGKNEDTMVAHAWTRTGSFYLTGGTGEGYAVVAWFRR